MLFFDDVVRISEALGVLFSDEAKESSDTLNESQSLFMLHLVNVKESRG